ncbi:MAG: hypothetical protein OEZ13_07415 [Spirochaetia bacterium]|nr:hypothetical protein [Spirochaetia bacterium]
MIFISTSNGIFKLKDSLDLPAIILKPESSLGFFGIVYYAKEKSVLAASREKYRLNFRSKHSTDVKIYEIDLNSLESRERCVVPKVYDVHQIEIINDTLFLTDTTLNRIHVFDLISNKTKGIINVGSKRKDINHINALLKNDNELWIGLNNRGRSDSEILMLSAETALMNDGLKKIDALKTGKIVKLSGYQHTHDLEVYNEAVIACASKQDSVFRTDNLEIIVHLKGFIRGLASDKEGLWVGISPTASRAERHKSNLDAELCLFSHNDFQLIKKIIVPGAGQLCDLLYVPK